MKILATILAIAIIVPPAFLIIPQRTLAALPVFETNPALVATTPVIAAKTTFSSIKDALNLISTYTNTAANVAQEINAYVLQPLAFVLSGDLMKMLTAGVIQFVIGKANGTGIPQFVTDVQKSMQTVGDAKALAFFDQFGRNSNSPFASAISSSLRNDYLSKTSLAGFWAANMNTLARSTPSYAPGYLAGNWQQGGIRAWFALTTQVQNNPYTFYQNSQDQLGTVVGPGVGGATGARMAELGWGNGFMSWCGASDTTIGAVTTTDVAAPSATGVNPGDPCTDTKSGLSGTIKTPGSVIVATLNKVLGGQQDIITRMGNVGPEINGILKNISTVMQTVNFATQILGGADTNGSFAQSGLLGIGQTSASNPTSRLSQFQNSPGNLGVTPSTVYKNAATLPVSGSDTLNRVVQYESSWNTIRGAANSASTTVVSLAKFCTAAADKAALTMTVNEFGTQITPSTDLSTIHSVFIDAARAQADTVRSAITTQIAPVIVRANTAFASISTTRAFIQRLQNGLNSGVSTTSSGYLADLQTLQSMPPSDSDLGDALIEVESFNTATAIPAGSLTVAGGSIIDRMSLISTNAEALKTTVCNPASSLYVTEVVSGG